MAVQNWQRWTGQQLLAKKRRKKNSLMNRYARMRFMRPGRATAPVTQAHYRRPADTIIEEPNGNMLWANGIDNMLRFTPYNGLLETAGMQPPAGAITLGGDGAGQIVGTFYAYMRFVDRDGNYSSLSTLSNVYTPAVTSAVISGVTYASPMVVTTSTAHGLGNGQLVKISGVIGALSANGVWTTANVTSTTFALVNYDGTNSLGSGVYVSGGTVVTGNSRIRYDNVPTTTEAKVVRRQILRNKDGEASVFYIDIDTTDLTSGTLYSTTTSQSLSGPVSILDTNGNSLTDFTPPPSGKKIIAVHQGRIFAAGAEPYSEGAVALTNGSATVNGIGTEWGVLTFPTRLFTVAGGNQTYTIESVQSQTQLTLTTPYTGTTDPYAYYTILPANSLGKGINVERRTIYWTTVSNPEGWPPANQETLSEDPGAGEITGLMTLGQYLMVLAQNRIYQLSWQSDPALDGYVSQAAQRGCVNNRCWVKTEDAAWMMDTRGIHIFSGNDDVPIGSVEIQDLFRPVQQGPYTINWAASRFFHAVFDPGECVMRWFVTMGGAYTPHHAICYQVRLRRWWLEEYSFPIGASCLGRLNGKQQVFLGSDNKRIFALNTSTLDGLDPSTGTVHSTVTSAGTTWIADSTAAFPSANLVGNPVSIVNGTGKGQRRTIVSVSGATINVDHPWTQLPDTTSVYQIGGIFWTWKSGWRRWAPDADNSVRAVHLQYQPTSQAASTYLRLYQDFNTTANAWATTQSLADGNGIALLQNDPTTDLSIDTTKANGYVWQRADSFRDEYTDAPRFMSVEVAGWSNVDGIQIRSMRIDGVQ